MSFVDRKFGTHIPLFRSKLGFYSAERMLHHVVNGSFRIGRLVTFIFYIGRVCTCRHDVIFKRNRRLVVTVSDY